MAERYPQTVAPSGHPNAWADGRIYTHVLVMSQKIGRALVDEEQVHHIDENRSNNHPDNLMLFANAKEHLAHHAQERAFAACGERFFMKCRYCKDYDDPVNMKVYSNANGSAQAHHKSCAIEYQNIRKLKSL